MTYLPTSAFLYSKKPKNRDLKLRLRHVPTKCTHIEKKTNLRKPRHLGSNSSFFGARFFFGMPPLRSKRSSRVGTHIGARHFTFKTRSSHQKKLNKKAKCRTLPNQAKLEAILQIVSARELGGEKGSENRLIWWICSCAQRLYMEWQWHASSEEGSRWQILGIGPRGWVRGETVNLY